MSEKFKQNIAELYTLANQLRLELNQIRRKEQPFYHDYERKSTKKHFIVRTHPPTDVMLLSAEPQKPLKVQQKKHYNKSSIFHQDLSKSRQKKHFAKGYGDSVCTEIPSRRRRSSYLNIRQNRSISPIGTSLTGLGERKQLERPRSSIRLFPEQHVFKRGLI